MSKKMFLQTSSVSLWVSYFPSSFSLLEIFLLAPRIVLTRIVIPVYFFQMRRCFDVSLCFRLIGEPYCLWTLLTSQNENKGVFTPYLRAAFNLKLPATSTNLSGVFMSSANAFSFLQGSAHRKILRVQAIQSDRALSLLKGLQSTNRLLTEDKNL